MVLTHGLVLLSIIAGVERMMGRGKVVPWWYLGTIWCLLGFHARRPLADRHQTFSALLKVAPANVVFMFTRDFSLRGSVCLAYFAC